MRWSVLIALSVAMLASSARADVLELPKTTDAVPLLVVLHGDRDTAKTTAARWRAATKERGWAMLALDCPRDQKCAGSWWQWAGDPAWVIARVAAVQKQHAIDPARIYLAGWSGGASYIGMMGGAWASTFAAVVLHGGGIPPTDDACPARPLPAYFLVGDANPLHRLAKQLRAWFDGCKQSVAWDVIARGDHDKEERALTRAKALAILDWLSAHGR